MNEIIEAIKKLSHRQHEYCEDPWYSCPLAEDGCADDSIEQKCRCGADAANEKLAALFKQLEDKIKQLEQFRQELIDDWAESHTKAYDSCLKLGLIDQKKEEQLHDAGAGYFYDIPELVEMFVKKIESLDQSLRWIPVTEQLPPDKTDVDFLCVGGYDGYGHSHHQNKEWCEKYHLPYDPTPTMTEYEGGPYHIGKDDFGNWAVTHWRLRPGTQPDFEKFFEDNK